MCDCSLGHLQQPETACTFCKLARCCAFAECCWLASLQALVDRPDEVRRVVSFKRIALTDFKVDIPRLAKKTVLKKALEESGALPVACQLQQSRLECSPSVALAYVCGTQPYASFLQWCAELPQMAAAVLPGGTHPHLPSSPGCLLQTSLPSGRRRRGARSWPAEKRRPPPQTLSATRPQSRRHNGVDPCRQPSRSLTSDSTSAHLSPCS